MISKNQNGTITSIVLIVVLTLTLIGALGFGFWAFGQSKDYKGNYQKKSSADVSAALAVQQTELQKKFDEQSKLPTKNFQGSTTYGTVSFSYPKTWSGYVDQGGSGEPINGYFHPDVVPSIQSGTAYALRVELLGTDYDQAVKQFSSQVKAGTLTAEAYLPPKLVGVKNAQPGVLFNGSITPDITGKVLIIKVRDKTLKISTLSKDYFKDFTDTVLPSLNFVP